MDRKNRRHKGAPPKGRSHLSQDQKEQDRRRHVEQDIGEMMSCRIQTEDLAVQHVGDPGHWMPVGSVEVSERPNGAVDRQTSGDLEVLEHVIDIINVHEIVAKRLAENKPCDCPENNANSENQPSILPISGSPFGLRPRDLSREGGSFFFAQSLAHSGSMTRSFGWRHQATIEQSRFLTTVDIYGGESSALATVNA